MIFVMLFVNHMLCLCVGNSFETKITGYNNLILKKSQKGERYSSVFLSDTISEAWISHKPSKLYFPFLNDITCDRFTLFTISK